MGVAEELREHFQTSIKIQQESSVLELEQKKKSDKKIEECFIHEAYQMLSKVVMKHQENQIYSK